jgi:hypothetical protein
MLDSFSRVIDKVMHIQPLDHYKKYSILAEEKFGFREDSSTGKAIY